MWGFLKFKKKVASLYVRVAAEKALMLSQRIAKDQKAAVYATLNSCEATIQIAVLHKPATNQLGTKG